MKKGFGLLETVLAAGVLTLVLAGVVSLGRISLRLATVNQTRTQAFQIAQEGMEGVRAIRDTNMLDGDNNTGWDKGLDEVVDGAVQTGDVAYNTLTKKWQFSVSSCSPSASFYTRCVTLNKTSADEIEVTAVVSFENGAKQIELKTILTNWRQES